MHIVDSWGAALECVSSLRVPSSLIRLNLGTLVACLGRTACLRILGNSTSCYWLRLLFLNTREDSAVGQLIEPIILISISLNCFSCSGVHTPIFIRCRAHGRLMEGKGTTVDHKDQQRKG